MKIYTRSFQEYSLAETSLCYQSDSIFGIRALGGAIFDTLYLDAFGGGWRWLQRFSLNFLWLMKAHTCAPAENAPAQPSSHPVNPSFDARNKSSIAGT